MLIGTVGMDRVPFIMFDPTARDTIIPTIQVKISAKLLLLIYLPFLDFFVFLV